LVNIKTTYPLELVAMDFLSLEASKSGIENILVVTDHFTKYAIAIPCKNRTAKTTADALYNNFIVHYGIPTRLHSNQGANFESEIIKELCHIMGMEKTHTTTNHPMGNGITERYNRTLLNMLGTLDPDKKANWKKYVPSLVYAHNCTPHETTKVSPFELMFGREHKLPIDILFEIEVETTNKTTKEYLTELKQRLKETQDIVNRVTEDAKKKQKEVYDRRAKASRIEIGDSVLVKILAFDRKHKIADRFELPDLYQVITHPNSDIPVFDIRSPTGTVKRLHRNHLYPVGSVRNSSAEDIKRVKELPKEITISKPRPIPRIRASLNVTGTGKVSLPAGTREVKRDNVRSDVTDSEDERLDEYVAKTYYEGDRWIDSLKKE
jgi:transposase InsO family protein